MNYRGQLPFLPGGCGCQIMALQSMHHGTIEVGGRELDGVIGNHPHIEVVEPTRVPILPGSILDDHVITDAIPLCFGKRAVRDLVHANRTRSRSIYCKRVERPGPAPVGPYDRIA